LLNDRGNIMDILFVGMILGLACLSAWFIKLCDKI